MNEYTFNRKLYKLVTDLNNHPHKDELLNIMSQQIEEDCVKVDLTNN